MQNAKCRIEKVFLLHPAFIGRHHGNGSADSRSPAHHAGAENSCAAADDVFGCDSEPQSGDQVMNAECKMQNAELRKFSISVVRCVGNIYRSTSWKQN